MTLKPIFYHEYCVLCNITLGVYNIAQTCIYVIKLEIVLKFVSLLFRVQTTLFAQSDTG